MEIQPDEYVILIVDDDIIISLATKMELEKHYGYRVLTAHNAESALKTVRESPSVGLVLMDIDLGAGMDGTEAAKIIIEERDIPVIFVSSHTEKEIVKRTEKTSGYGYIVKDSDITVYDASIKMAIRLFSSREDLLNMQTTFRSSLEYLDEAVIVTDTEGRFFGYNNAFARMHNLTDGESISTMDGLIGLFDVYTHDQRLAAFGDMPIARGLAGETGHKEKHYIVRTDISHVWICSTTFAPIKNARGDIIGAVVVTVDITHEDPSDPFFAELLKKYCCI